MGIRYVIADPEAAPQPGWWAKNKAVVCAVAGLSAGLWLAGGCGHSATTGPVPSSSTSSTPTPAASTTGSPR
ncbi:hypothetical protein [Kitasatospora sp. HPMI-4]|uniref:hypothetical protein n=1 Tax=Kitasatospora sp. HPMI-4 TaxID=3448443 RepID=UPI003F1E0F5A